MHLQIYPGWFSSKSVCKERRKRIRYKVSYKIFKTILYLIKYKLIGPEREYSQTTYHQFEVFWTFLLKNFKHIQNSNYY